jgi:uncharacterized protein (TIGR02217 family)
MTVAQFLHVRMPDEVAYGFARESEFNTDIATLESGAETRNITIENPYRNWTAEYEKFTPELFAELDNHFNGVYGSGCGFLYKDHFDFTVVNQSLGVAPSGSTAVQLYKDYTVGSNVNRRIIRKPVDDTLVLRQGGDLFTVTMDPTTGLIIPAAPWTPGETLLIEYLEFDCAVRFENDKLASSYVQWRAISTNCRLMEIDPP